jgi:molybdenum cofactor guanylyltransferase
MFEFGSGWLGSTEAKLKMSKISGVVLAGGLSSRMGGDDKTLLTLAHKPILQHVIERLAPQVDDLIISANGNAQRFDAFKLPVVADTVADHMGPLAGILAGLEWTIKHHPHTPWMMSVSGDTPFLPLDVVAQLLNATQKTKSLLSVVRTQGFCHPTIGLWNTQLAESLRHALVEEALRKVSRFTERYPLSIVDFDHTPIDPFFNINTPDDLAQAERFLRGYK